MTKFYSKSVSGIDVSTKFSMVSITSWPNLSITHFLLNSYKYIDLFITMLKFINVIIYLPNT